MLIVLLFLRKRQGTPDYNRPPGFKATFDISSTVVHWSNFPLTRLYDISSLPATAFQYLYACKLLKYKENVKHILCLYIRQHTSVLDITLFYLSRMRRTQNHGSRTKRCPAIQFKYLLTGTLTCRSTPCEGSNTSIQLY